MNNFETLNCRVRSAHSSRAPSLDASFNLQCKLMKLNLLEETRTRNTGANLTNFGSNQQERHSHKKLFSLPQSQINDLLKFDKAQEKPI